MEPLSERLEQVIWHAFEQSIGETTGALVEVVVDQTQRRTRSGGHGR